LEKWLFELSEPLFLWYLLFVQLHEVSPYTLSQLKV
jgi:hypothetical protein